MNTNLDDVVDYIVSLVIEGDLTWDLPEAFSYRRQLKELSLIEESPLGLLYTPHEKRSRRKLSKRLRRKLRTLNHKTATMFSTRMRLSKLNEISPHLMADYIVKVLISPEEVYITIWKESRASRKKDVADISDAYLKHKLTSVDFPKLALLPAFLRVESAVNLPEESSYDKKDF